MNIRLSVPRYRTRKPDPVAPLPPQRAAAGEMLFAPADDRLDGLVVEDGRIAGVILDTLHHAADTQGARFPLDLGARGSATVGGGSFV